MRSPGDARAWGAIACAAAVAVVSAAPRLGLEATWDGPNVYLPMARSLIGRGLAFLAQPESVRMPPLSYAWPALFGANEHATRVANLALFPILVVLVACAAWTHSRRAAVWAAFLAALSPLLRLWMPDVMTEPPFLALTAAWLFAISRLCAGAGTGWVAVAAASFTLASLTRPAASLFGPIACALFALRALKARQPLDRAIDARLAVAHAAGTLGWLAWLLHNGWTFGFPAIASGAGTALWLGLAPLTDGFDPMYFGLNYDDGDIARDMNHLSIEGDRLLYAAGVLQFHDLPWSALGGLMLRKAIAFVFVTPYEAPGASPAWMAAFRVALVVLAAVALARRPRSRLVQVAAGFALYMLAIHLPLLYTLRYSVGALDLPLTLLAGIGAAECAALPVASVAAAAFLLGIAARAPAMSMPRFGAPRIEHGVLATLWERAVADVPVRAQRAVRTAPRSFELEPGAALEVDVRGPGFHPWKITLATIDLALTPAGGKACGPMRVGFRGLDEPSFDPQRVVPVALQSDGLRHVYTLGTTLPLRLVREGTLRLAFDCPVAARLEMGTIRVSASTRGLEYHARVQAARSRSRER